MKRFALFLACILLSLPALAQAWWNDDWSFRKQLILDTTAAGADIKGNLQDVPVLIRLHAGNFNYFLDLKQDGSDLRFIGDDDKTPLKFHIEKFDPINEIALIWVKLPKVSAGAKTQNFWMYYGNQKAEKAEDAAGTYGVKQGLVYHFENKEGAPSDQTAYHNNPSRYSAEYTPSALIGGGAHFASSQVITIPASPSLQLTAADGWTFSTWLKIDVPQKEAFIMSREEGGRAMVIGIDGTDVYARLGQGEQGIQTPPGVSITPGTWHHLAVTAGQGGLIIYIDGAEAASVPTTLSDLGGDISVGAAADGSHGFSGDMDEVGIAATARSTDWVKAAAGSQGMDAKLVTYGSDDQHGGGGGTSYFGVILQNVTVDGWVVIVILVIMSAISWVVMVGKGLIIRRVRRDNQSFLEQFRQLTLENTDKLDQAESEKEHELAEASPLLNAMFGKHDHFQSSPLYRIYHQGIHELNQRVGTTVGAQASGISDKGVNAIRATLDAVLVRESQKINAQMVLLTIAISGGPFLGLLGTVVGVMITFAAIAASGDVNINAIAPGIAAALVATVAGLAVAIPALFGYNYLASSIKTIVADMHVFVDEFISKTAEHYGE